VDAFIKQIIIEYINGHCPQVKNEAIIYMENFKVTSPENPSCTIFIDPVDGSRSADQHIGAPCFMIAFSSKTDDIHFRDLQNCFVRGIHSGDSYFTFCSKAYYVPGGYSITFGNNGEVIVNKELVLNPIKMSHNPERLKDATVIVRDGYGMREIVSKKIDHSILNAVKHTFSYDITGIELCYLASGRNIVHLLVEARRHFQNGKAVGSDGYNLIPYPLIKAVGGNIYLLNGQSLDDILYKPQEIYDFIAGINPILVQEFVHSSVKQVSLVSQSDGSW
jgi:fructose-1,6-bisphosphatase/inositol monophosphatase family enzyme